MPVFKTGLDEDCTLTSDGNVGAGTVNVSSAVSGVPEGPVPSSATVRSPGGPNKSAAKSAPVKIASDAEVNAPDCSGGPVMNAQSPDRGGCRQNCFGLKNADRIPPHFYATADLTWLSSRSGW
jgi:hypothetical protein